jgi:MFS family permease
VPELRLWPRGGLWRQPDFLRLWSAQTISQLGSQISALALPLAAILVLDASAFEVALLGTIEFLPFLLFALPAGVWVDRLRRKPILVAADLIRGGLLASIPLAYALDALTLGQLYVVGFGTGVCTVFFDVAYQSYLPSLVDRASLVEGNSKLEVSRSGAQLAGPGLAGVLVGAFTAPYAILADAVSFVVSALLVVRIRCEEAVPERTAKPSMRRELVEGLRYLLGHRFWRPIAITVAISNFFNTLAFSIFLVYLVRDLELSAQVIGIVLAVSNVGWLAGAVAARRVSDRLGVGPTLVAAPLLFGPGLLLIPAAVAADPLHRRWSDPRYLRGHRVQRHRHLVPAGRRSGPHARPPQCDAALHRVGCDPARLAHRGRPRLPDRAPRDALGGRDLRLAQLPTVAPLIRALDRPHGGCGARACRAGARDG